MKKLRFLVAFAITSFTFMAASVLLLPLSEAFNATGGKRFVTYLLPALFWAGLIIGIVLMILAKNQRKKIKLQMSGLPGIISFFKNKESIAAIMICILGAVVVLVAGLTNISQKFIVQIIGLFFVIWGFSLHCVFDGLNYRALKNKKEETRNEEETK